MDLPVEATRRPRQESPEVLVVERGVEEVFAPGRVGGDVVQPVWERCPERSRHVFDGSAVGSRETALRGKGHTFVTLRCQARAVLVPGTCLAPEPAAALP